MRFFFTHLMALWMKHTVPSLAPCCASEIRWASFH